MGDWTDAELLAVRDNYDCAAAYDEVFTDREAAERAAVNTEIASRGLDGPESEYPDDMDTERGPLDSDPHEGDDYPHDDCPEPFAVRMGWESGRE